MSKNPVRDSDRVSTLLIPTDCGCAMSRTVFERGAMPPRLARFPYKADPCVVGVIVPYSLLTRNLRATRMFAATLTDGQSLYGDVLVAGYDEAVHEYRNLPAGFEAGLDLTETESSQPERVMIDRQPGCPECQETGYELDDRGETCDRCSGTGEYTGILDKYGNHGVNAVYGETRYAGPDVDPRVVYMETSGFRTALTIAGVEELTSRLYDAVREHRRREANCARTAALAAGERPLETVREQLGARAFNCLGREGVFTIEQAARMSDKELLAIVNLGDSTLQKIRAVVGHSSQPGTSEASPAPEGQANEHLPGNPPARLP